MEKNLQFYLKNLIYNGGSDLHLKSGAIVRIRINGDLLKLSNRVVSFKELDGIAKAILTQEEYEELRFKKELDTTYILDDDHRFRVNFFYQLDGLSAVMRVIPMKILTLEELRLPSVVTRLSEMHRGLILVTGVTGSGKSTTLAAMLDHINSTKKKHIITVEDPIEFIHFDKESLISQREVGKDTLSFSNALKSALREDPDIILIGEMRDLETIEIALHAANTGHLVFSTLHTLDAKGTINRIIGMFPKEEQNRIRLTLSSVLVAVIAQRLVKTVDGNRAAALEVMVQTPRVIDLIAQNRDAELLDAIEEGREIYGSQSFDQALLKLYCEKRIDKDLVFEYATSVADIKLKLDRGCRTQENREEEASSIDFFELKEKL